MPWIALRRVKLRGRQYEKGDEIRDAHELRNRRMLVATGHIVEIPDAAAPGASGGTPAGDRPNLRAMKRDDLNAYAAGLGVADPTAHGKKEDLVAVIERMWAAGDADAADESGSEPTPTLAADADLPAPTVAFAPAPAFEEAVNDDHGDDGGGE